jgi:hypothetical protein
MKQGREEQEDGKARRSRRPPRPPPCDFRFLLSQFQLFSTPARARAAETLKLERVLSAECGVQNAEWSLLRVLRPHSGGDRAAK